jgi:pyruvate ferredoxin oxidoreductase gamma subunit
MLQINLHGRGGQGVVTASEMLASAAYSEGHEVQSFPNFGSERMGAPVLGYVRIDEHPIRTHEPILKPDVVIVQDPTLLKAVDVFKGMNKETAVAVINTVRPAVEVKADAIDAPNKVVTVPADAIVREFLGQNKPSAAMLGAFAAATGALSLKTITGAFEERFSGKVAEGNVLAAKVAYAWVKDGIQPPVAGPAFPAQLAAQIKQIGTNVSQQLESVSNA